MKLAAAVAAAAATLTIALARPAAAAPDPFQQYLVDLAANPKAADAYLAHCDLALLPSGEARTPCKVALADLVGAQTGVTLVAKRVKDDSLSKSTVEYLDADVEARAGGKTIATFHVLEVGGFGPDAFVPMAVHWARTISDKDAAAKAKAKQLPAELAIPDVTVPMAKGTDEQAVSDYGEGITEGKQWISGDVKDGLPDVAADGVVFGSAPGQRYAGKAAAKAIKGWKLSLQQHGEYAAAGGDLVIVIATELVATTATKDKLVTPYAALIVMSMQMIPGSGDHVWYPRMVSFGVPQ